jgi:hypothetical protein
MTTPHDFAPQPPPPRLISIDPAEFIALRTIVVVLVGALAGHFERSGVSAAQDWINGIAEVCANAINGAEFTGFPDAERVMCGRLRVGKGFRNECSIGRSSHVFGLRARFTRPLAIMPSADQVPIKSSHSTML